MSLPVLVVGYGSDLRGDDAAGRRVAEALEAAGLPGVEARVLHQLAPELAPDLAGRDLVVFVDASVTTDIVTAEALDPRPGGPVTTHHVGPGALLAVASLLGCSPHAAVAVSVPAFDLGLGTELSPRTAAGVAEATARVTQLCRRARDAAAPGAAAPGAAAPGH